MKNTLLLLNLLFLLPVIGIAQSDPHYTMFMYNKLLFNPGYAGSRELTSINALYRNQWTGINGAPKNINITADGLLGSYMKPFRKVALGLSLTNEKIGVESNTNIMAYYAYRIQVKGTILSFGLRGGAKLYSAQYGQLNPSQINDPNLANDVRRAFLPNAGAGAYWSGDKFYAGFSVPSLLQNYYDKYEKTVNAIKAREIRSYYLNGGYVFTMNETIKLQPQAMIRLAKNAAYNLPLSSDFNLSAIAYDRFLVGFTYRTDKSFEAIVHVQATKNLNIGYSFDYMLSGLNGYNGGSHELVVGFDLVKDHSKYVTPRFVKTF
jgi:type IX secretion system PorP/SprF family membrane protein